MLSWVQIHSTMPNQSFVFSCMPVYQYIPSTDQVCTHTSKRFEIPSTKKYVLSWGSTLTALVSTYLYYSTTLYCCVLVHTTLYYQSLSWRFPEVWVHCNSIRKRLHVRTDTNLYVLVHTKSSIPVWPVTIPDDNWYMIMVHSDWACSAAGSGTPPFILV